MGKPFFVALATLIVVHVSAASSAEHAPAWTIVLRPADYVIGPALAQLRTRRTWAAAFDDRSSVFEIAVRKTAVAIPAPRCRMDYLVLTISVLLPGKSQAGVGQRAARRL